MTDSIRITLTPLDSGQAVNLVTDPAAGGIAVFIGTTRAETSNGRQLLALDYEAFTEMAERQLAQLLIDVRQKWPVLRAVLWHRIGRVNVGEPSVIIAVATPHRAESFAACHWLIDELKASVTIWKKELWDDAGESWVDVGGTAQR